jgi:hypothetical protein
MKDQDLLFEYAGTPLDQLPEAVQQRLQEDPALREELQSQARISQVMGLKRYEKPEPAVAGRVRENIRHQIRNMQPGRGILVEFPPMPDWMRMAAAVMLMLGLSVMTHREMLEPASEEGGTGPIELADTLPPANEMLRPPAYLLHTEDPFVTTVEFPVGSEFGTVPFTLPDDLDEDLESMLLREALRDPYRTGRSPLAPVLFQPMP